MQMSSQNAPPGYAPPGYPPSAGDPAYQKMSSTNPMNLIWFAAAVCVLVASLITFIAELFDFAIVDAVEMVYLFLFALVLAVLDTPLFTNIKIVPDMRQAIGKYFALVQRVTGKGLIYIFLSATLWAAMWANLESYALKTLGVIVGLFVFVVGLASLAIGIMKSRNLDLVRKRLHEEGANSLGQMYEMHARMNPAAGITQEEFKKMTPYARGVSFESNDIKLIFNALSSNPRRDVISRSDLEMWVNGHIVFI